MGENRGVLFVFLNARFNVPDRSFFIQKSLHEQLCYRSVMFLLTSNSQYDMFPIGNMNTTNSDQLGATIRARRKQLKVTQKDLALTCGTGLRFISDLENGKPTCQIGKILQVLQALRLKLQITGQSEAS